MAHVVHVVEKNVLNGADGKYAAWHSTWYSGDGAEQAAHDNCGNDGWAAETTPHWVVRGGIWRSDRKI